MKLQVREWIIRLNIRDLICEVGTTIYTLVWLCTGNSSFSWSNLQENTVFHESGPILHEGGPAQRMVLKAISKKGFSGFIAARD